jgi:hypothetical protein
MNTRKIIIELAKYLNGDISDTNGLYESFFYINPSNCYCALDGIVDHFKKKGIKMRHDKINRIDPHKRRCFNFQDGSHYVTVTSQGSTKRFLVYK